MAKFKSGDVTFKMLSLLDTNGWRHLRHQRRCPWFCSYSLTDPARNCSPASHRREQGRTAILETELVLRDFGPRCQQNVAADEIKQNAKHDERNQCEQVGAGAVEEWVVHGLPILD